MPTMRALVPVLALVPLVALIVSPGGAAAQVRDSLLPIPFERSAEYAWLQKPVLASRVLDDMTDPSTWRLQGTGELSFPTATGPGGLRFLRVDMRMFTDEPAPTRNRLSAVNLRRPFEGEDWSGYNRLSLWIRPDVAGFPMLPLQIVLHNDGVEKVPDEYYREGIHYVTLTNDGWQQVVWEIEPLARDRVTAIEIGYWVNKMLADPADRVGFEVGRLELQRVEPDHYAGWSVAPGRIAYSHSGYPVGSSKTALARDLAATDFRLIRLDGEALGVVAFMGPVETVETRLGRFQRMDFSAVREPGRYTLQAGDVRTRPFRIDDDPWRGSVDKALNFFFGQRCGHVVPGSHGVCHADWTATFGGRSIVMNGGWHDAGDLSQGMVNTGEAVYAMFALAERLRETGRDPELLALLLDEAKWGLDWVLRVRFDGGHRIGFASHNLWTNNILGDADDRSREATNNPNVNYIAAAAAAIAARVLRDDEPALAARSLRIAADDWRHAIAGVETPENLSTPAYAASPVELAGIGTIASLELYEATRDRAAGEGSGPATGAGEYAAKAIELARVIVASQEKRYVGTDHPLAGFFYTGPDRATIFHQFHRGNDQAPVVALARLARAFPDHPEWMDWYATVALHAEYQKAGARTTAPYGVLPAYVYRDTDHLQVDDTWRHRATREAYRAQVLEGLSMGHGHYLRAFPVWFARRGNYGVLLSQAKALSAASRLRRDLAGADLAQRQAQWIVGRNPFTQSTMYGEGYDWAQQYAVSSGDFVGALPVGMQSHGVRDVPYWPGQNMYVYKEVWVHPVSRWLWLMRDLAGPGLLEGRVAPGAARPGQASAVAPSPVAPSAVAPSAVAPSAVAPSPVELVDAATGRVVTVSPDPDGSFRAFVPQGRHVVRADGRQTTVAVLAGDTRWVDLRPGHVLELALAAETAPDGTVTLRLTARGEGTHTFELRSHNLDVPDPERRLTLRPDALGTVTWLGRPAAADGPWVVVVVPDGDVGGALEATSTSTSTSSSARGGALDPGADVVVGWEGDG